MDEIGVVLTKQKCRVCGVSKEIQEFHKSSSNSSGYDYRCKLCKKTKATNFRATNYFKAYISTKKSECKTKGITFDLDAEYLEEIATSICPIFRTELNYNNTGRGSHKEGQAHLDRIEPSLGYVKGNVCWVNGRANRIKYNATVEELEAIIRFIKGNKCHS